MGNNLNWKNVKYFMDMWNPYDPNNNTSNSDNYNDLWKTVRTLAVLNFEPGNTLFPKMVKYDGELFNKEY